MAVPTLFASRLATIMGRRGAKKLVAGTRAVRGASAAVLGARALSKGASSRAHSTAASHEAPFCLASPPPADPEALRSRWREEALSLLATPSTSPDDDRSRWREQCLAIAGGAEAPPRDSHELGGYFS
uniref:Uncharacterized protein n=1 Tax=Pelagomonas calceolata TaxID=35677 RepID=A0A7S4A6F6_9STRA|mmetsp:Transcript_13110/g.38124  ORF Transcript_13110/g.38124 Transcript_13110/m.38124 type:complete len:128 (-) Transcript_13110:110-493(-)